MQVFSISEFYFILPAGYSSTEGSGLKNLATDILEFKQIEVIRFNAEHFDEMLTYVGKSPTMKILDKFFMFNFPDQNQVITQSFFDYIAPKYDSLINKELNISLIEKYLKVINETFPEKLNKNVLDLGSGSGISFSVKNLNPYFSKMTLYGYETSPKMEKLSKQAGLKMLNQNALKKNPDYFFDAIFGSYSFHFFQNNSIYQTIWDKLSFGGIILANFHKKIGLENALIFFRSVNAEINQLDNHANSYVYIFKKKIKPFILISEAAETANSRKDNKLKTDVLIDYLVAYSIIPTYLYENLSYILEDDLLRLMNFFQNLDVAHWDYSSLELYDQNFCVQTGGLKLEFSSVKRAFLEDFNPTLLIDLLVNDDGQSDGKTPIYVAFGNSLRITINSAKLKKLFIESNREKIIIESARAPYFANSASYMGSKKSLRQFLYFSIKSTVPKSYKSLDLMCGAGSVASILSMRYQTYVADAMQFSKVLAIVQGSGISAKKAHGILEKLRFSIKVNFSHLTVFFQEALRKEDVFFHQRIDVEAKIAYQNFCLEYSFANPFYRSRYSNIQLMESAMPFELFSLAYSNTFFGLKQAMQIDSLRYAIETLENESEKTWALGALVATVSAVANTYAGHFAQPKYKDITALSESEFIRLIEQRSLSIISEFEVRLNAFARESESNNLSIITPVEGAWPAALNSFVDKFPNDKKFVYVDAPYTRDEYSRYYHVLETLIDYKYYNLTGLGKLPEKKSGARFKSNFFTRNAGQLKTEFLNLFTTVINNGCICGWSYSNSASGDCLEVIYETVLRTGCSVESFEIPYEYKGQGGRLAKKIKEYYVVFKPKTR